MGISRLGARGRSEQVASVFAIASLDSSGSPGFERQQREASSRIADRRPAR